jgi:hypothetical protein
MSLTNADLQVVSGVLNDVRGISPYISTMTTVNIGQQGTQGPIDIRTRTDLSGSRLGQINADTHLTYLRGGTIAYDMNGRMIDMSNNRIDISANRMTGNILHVEPSNAFSEIESLSTVAWEGGQNMSEEDILANTNLQTASLFKTFKRQLNDCNKFLELYTEQSKEFQDSIAKVSLGMQSIKKICNIYNEAGLEKIQQTYLDLEKELGENHNTVVSEINKKICEKNSEIDKITMKLNSLRKIILTGIDEIVKPDDMQKKMCPICFENEVNTVFVPCGHTYCKPCSDIDLGRHTKCHQCRSPVNARVKLYFTV